MAPLRIHFHFHFHSLDWDVEAAARVVPTGCGCVVAEADVGTVAEVTLGPTLIPVRAGWAVVDHTPPLLL
jgi:hypothetical protein